MTEIRTVEELLALPVGTVVERPNGAVDKLDHERSGAYVGDQWFIPRDSTVWLGALTVLYRPDLPTQADLHAAVERVRRMHRPDPNDNAFCESCDRQFPCPTWRELGGAP